jgi:hypothetical protein
VSGWFRITFVSLPKYELEIPVLAPPIYIFLGIKKFDPLYTLRRVGDVTSMDSEVL